MDSAVASHGNYFHQLDSRSPVWDADRAPVRCAAVTEIVTAAAETDDCPNRVAPQQLGAEIDRRLHADAVEHEARATWSDDVLDALGCGCGVAIVNNVVR